MKRQIVDEHDKLIGYKTRDEITHPDDIYRVSALWLTNAKGEILLAQRGLSLRNGPGLWGPAVAGTVEEGETYESNIYKEAEEEIGLTDYTFTVSKKLFVNGHRRYFCQFFTAVIDRPAEEFQPDPREVAQVRWINPKALRQEVAAHPERFTPSFSSVSLDAFVPSDL